MDKKEWLDYLYYNIGKQNCNFWIAGTYGNNGERKFTKWKKYRDCVANIDIINLKNNNWKDLEFFNNINQRQILPNEVVLDLEEKTQLLSIVDKLDKLKWNFYVFSTGSRGFHIHVFFNRYLSVEDKRIVIESFGADIMKIGEKTLIALEYSKHWKSGKLKTPWRKEDGI